jgi:hypothetical protein
MMAGQDYGPKGCCGPVVFVGGSLLTGLVLLVGNAVRWVIS